MPATENERPDGEDSFVDCCVSLCHRCEATVKMSAAWTRLVISGQKTHSVVFHEDLYNVVNLRADSLILGKFLVSRSRQLYC